MPPILLRFLPHILGVAAIGLGLWYYGHTRYKAGQDDIRQEVAEQVAIATAETARIDAERQALSERIELELQPKLDAATSRASSLARRLRDYSSRGPLSEAAGGPSQPLGGSRESSDSDPVGTALAAHLGACARDAERLGGWQDWYGALPP